MKSYFPRPTKSLVIICVLTMLFMWLSLGLWGKKGMTVSFDAEAVKDLQYQVFYTTEEKSKFNEKQSVKQNVKKGKSKVKIVLPINEIVKFRLDLGISPEKIVISNLIIDTEKEKIEFKDFNKFHFRNVDKKELSENKLVTDIKHRDPYIIYKENLFLKARTIVDWHLFIILVTFYFFVTYKVVKYLAKFKIEKNYSRIDIVMLGVFFALLFVPMSRISDAEKSVQENRMLAKKPQLKDVWGG